MKAKLIVMLGAALLLPLSASTDGVTTNDAGLCPTIADHQKFINEINKGNFTYRNPRCVTVDPGTRFKGPFERKVARYGSKRTTFVLIEVPGRGRLWTLAFWVKIDEGASSSRQRTPAKIDPFVARTLQELSDFEETLEATYRFHVRSGDVPAWEIFSSNWNRRRQALYDEATKSKFPLIAVPIHDLFSLWQEMSKAVRARRETAGVRDWRKTARDMRWEAYRQYSFRPKSIGVVELGKTTFIDLQKRHEYSAKFLEGTNNTYGIATFPGTRLVFMWKKGGSGDVIFAIFPSAEE